MVEDHTKMTHFKYLKNALDFDPRVILSFRSPFLTLRFSLKTKSFGKQNIVYRSDMLHVMTFQFQVSKVNF